MRAALACLIAFALLSWTVAPASAAETSSSPEALQALALLDLSCDSTPAAERAARARLPSIKSMLSRAGRRSLSLATAPIPAQARLPADAGLIELAQAEATATPAVSPTPTLPAGDAGGTPLPGVSPTPALQRPPIGPGVLIPPTAPGQTAAPTAPAVPSPSPTPTQPTGPIPIVRPTGPPPTVAPVGGSPTPFAAPTAPGPQPSQTIAPLEPGKILLLADKYSGSTRDNQPQDFSGNVNLFYADGVIVGDQAHYDGVRYLDFTGNPYIRNNSGDTVFRGDIIRFDRVTQHATLLKGRGETTQGVEKGKLHFTSDEMITERSGRTMGTNTNWTTCENSRAGYHMQSKTFEMRPGDKIIARKVTVYLGAFAIFYLPILIIGLAQSSGPPRSSFLPQFGYSQSEGFWVKTRLGFGKGPYYNGYYRIEYFSRLGLGLGYSAVFGTRSARRNAQVDFYRSPPKPSGGANNFSLTENEQYNPRLRSTITTQYVSNYGPLVIGQPPSLTIGGSFGYTGSRSNEQFTFSRYSQGTLQGALNLGYTETLTFRRNLSEAFNVGYTRNYNSASGVASAIGTAHFQSLTNYTTNWALYSLNFDKTLSQTPSGKQVVPELQIQPRAIFPNQHIVPINTQLTIGDYTEPATPFSTGRGELSLNLGPAIAHFWNSDFSASLRVRQDAYATGDLKAQIDQQGSLTTPLGHHILNAITYSETNSNGPQAIPFNTFDLLSGASHSAQDVLQFYNRDAYVLRLSTGTAFNRAAQPVSYSLTVRPSYRSYVSVNGSFNPGPGNGFNTTQFQVITPFGRATDLQFAGTFDWKNKGRLLSKAIFLRKIIGDCYDVRISYNQDLKQVTVGFDILAFPSHGVNFGLGQTGSIISGNLTGAF